MSPKQGWFESDENYRHRVAQEADERTIENSSGSAPTKGWFESNEDYRDRVAQEANEHRVEDSTGDAPSRGWFEGEDSYRERIAQEANERTIEDSTGSAPSQGWFESDSDYDVRVRREANEHIVNGGTGSSPKQGWFEGDHDYRSRVAHEAREVRASNRPDSEASISHSSSSEGSINYGVSGRSTSSDSSGVVAVVVAVGLIIAVLSARQPSTPTPAPYQPPRAKPLKCVPAAGNDPAPWTWNSRVLESFPVDTPRPVYAGGFSDDSAQYELSLYRDSKGVFGELRSPILEADSPTSRLYDIHFDPKTEALSFMARFEDGERRFAGTLRANSVTGTLQHGAHEETVEWRRLPAASGASSNDFYSSRAKFECAMILFHRY